MMVKSNIIQLLREELFRLMEDDNKTNLIIKRGTRLFHATGEEFAPHELTTSAYDSILWTTTQSAIAQTYIPVAGSSIRTNTDSITMPSRNSTIQKIQKSLGIEYNYNEIEWDGNRIINGFRKPTIFKDLSYNDVKGMYDFVNNLLIKNFGYEPERESWSNNYSWNLKLSKEGLAKDDYRLSGKLFILRPKRDFKIFDMTSGGDLEGDLTDVDYHKLDWFRKAENAGYDGVKINDFAQIEDMGNFGHISIGIFKSSIKDLDISTIDNVTHPKDFHGKHFTGHNYDSEEFLKYLENE